MTRAAAVGRSVALTEVIEHLARPAAALAEVARCLPPGGVFVLTTDNRHGVTWTEWTRPLAVAAKLAPGWRERRAAAVLHRIDRALNAVPLVRALGMHWLVVGRKPEA